MDEMRQYILIRLKDRTIAVDVSNCPDEFIVELMVRGVL